MALRFVDGGTGLDLNVVRSFYTADGSRYHRALGAQWSLTDDDLIDTACQLADRQLTEEEWAKYIGESIPYQPSCT